MLYICIFSNKFDLTQAICVSHTVIKNSSIMNTFYSRQVFSYKRNKSFITLS